MAEVKTAIIGSGNIGTDLMIKIMRNQDRLDMAALVGVDSQSEGLAGVAWLNVATAHEGIDGLVKMPTDKPKQPNIDEWLQPIACDGARQRRQKKLQRHRRSEHARNS